MSLRVFQRVKDAKKFISELDLLLCEQGSEKGCIFLIKRCLFSNFSSWHLCLKCRFLKSDYLILQSLVHYIVQDLANLNDTLRSTLAKQLLKDYLVHVSENRKHLMNSLLTLTHLRIHAIDIIKFVIQFKFIELEPACTKVPRIFTNDRFIELRVLRSNHGVK